MPAPSTGGRQKSAPRRVIHVCALVVLVSLVAVLVVVSGRRTEHVPAAETPALPFDMPSTAVLRASPHKVFVNYFTPVPLSVDNRPASSDYYSRNYLTPEGENGAHAAYGGVWRDRPIPRPVSTSASWRLDDLKTEVRQAISAGIDGFYLDMLQLEGDPDVRVWETTQLMMQAAQEVDPGFEIALMPDLASTSMRRKDPATLAKFTARLAASPSAYRLSDGRLVVMPAAAEAHSVPWWRSYLQIMTDRYHIPVALVPIFIADEARYREQFASISFGMSTWGSANPQWNDPEARGATSPLGRATAVHELGQLWVQPVRVQGSRPKEGLYSEAENTTNLRQMWELAQQTKADWVQVPTWNDYSEGTQLAPSMKHGYTFLDLNSYFLTWYKTGSKPRIVRDMVYLTHRTQPVNARSSFEETLTMKTRGGSPPRDTVEALTFLTSPARVTIYVGSAMHICDVPAGMGACTVPLQTGSVSASVVRDGEQVARTSTASVVTDHPYVQNLEYVGSTSGRPTMAAPRTFDATPDPGQGTDPATPEDDSEQVEQVEPLGTDSVKTVTAGFDTYVNQASRDGSYSEQGLLASRGTPGYASYLRFRLPRAPAGTRLISARLKLVTGAKAYATSKDPHQVHLEAAEEVSARTTWTSRPAIAGPLLGRFARPDKQAEAAIADLDATALRSRTGSEVTLTVSSRGHDNWWFASVEAQSADRRPTLQLVYR